MALTEPQVEWLAALRNGKYKQGKHHLHNKDNTYCCLGVACDIIDSSLWHYEEDEECYGYSSSLYTTSLSDRYMDLFGINFGLEEELIEMNDNRDYTFEQIADWLENYWNGCGELEVNREV